MGRRSDHSRDELYVMALDAAETIVREDGLPALTARKVAARIGYTAGTLYNLFRNQDDLVIHLNARTLTCLDTELRQIRRTGDPQADILALGRAYVSFISGNVRLWHVLFDHRLAAGQELPDWYSARIDRMMGVVEDALTPLFPADAFADRRSAARLLWSAVHGVCSLSTSGKLGIVTDVPLTEAVDRLVTVLLAGMATTGTEMS
ncbi:MAG: TetR/AcrR family transcriptional regulator [Rhodospirillales bacterium]